MFNGGRRCGASDALACAFIGGAASRRSTIYPLARPGPNLRGGRKPMARTRKKAWKPFYTYFHGRILRS